MSRERGRDGREFDRGGRLSFRKKTSGKMGAAGNLSEFVSRLWKSGRLRTTAGNLSRLTQLFRVTKLGIKSAGNLFPSGYRTRNRILLSSNKNIVAGATAGNFGLAPRCINRNRVKVP
jgi:hypothetical protein